MKITKTMLIHRYGKTALMRPCCHTTSTDIIVKPLVEKNESIYAAFNGGMNLGAWRLRASGNYNWMTDSGSNYDFKNRYVQRDIASLRSQLILGESYTTGETFDSVSIRGIRLYSDSRMLPPTLASFAPIIHGVANTNAKVTITQGGYKIYETTVPPGAFVIDDLSPSGYGSDLIVTIEESDGSKRTFSQPFSSVVQMLRPGVGRWDISGGQVLKDDIQDEPNLFQASYYYGLNNYLTGYTGIQITDNNYTAGLLGLGLNTSVGAFSFDVTHSNVRIPDDKTYQGKVIVFLEQVIRRNKYFTEYRGLSLFDTELPWS